MKRISDLAKQLGVSSSTVRRWVTSGDGPEHIRTPKGTYLFRPEDVETWLKSLESLSELESKGDSES